MSETWKVIPDYPYEISNLGRVRRTVGGQGTWAGRLLSPSNTSSNGYAMVSLKRAGHPTRHALVHRLVADAFLGPPPGKNYEVAHLDGGKTNNRFDNLQWKTAAGNAADRLVHGTDNRGPKHKTSKLTVAKVRYIRRVRGRIGSKILGRKFGVTPRHIRAIASGREWSWLK